VDTGPCFNAALPDFHTICMHESPAGFTWGDTAASAVFVLQSNGAAEQEAGAKENTMHWCAGTPCTGAYLPISLEGIGGDDHACCDLEFLGRAGQARDWSPASPCPRVAPIDEPPTAGASEAAI
jgi:hypothetical protein